MHLRVKITENEPCATAAYRRRSIYDRQVKSGSLSGVLSVEITRLPFFNGSADFTMTVLWKNKPSNSANLSPQAARCSRGGEKTSAK